MNELLIALSITLAVCSAAFAWWDVMRRRIDTDVRRLQVESKFGAMQRDFELLSVATKKSIENLTESLDISVTDMKKQLAVEDMKRGMQNSRRIG